MAGTATAGPPQFTAMAVAKMRIVNGVRTLRFAWPEQIAGTCRLDVPSFVLDDTGKGIFRSTASTHDIHDAQLWRVSIDLEDENGYYLFGDEAFAGPPMTDGDPAPLYEFDRHFAWNPRIVGLVWSDIRKAQLHGTCSQQATEAR